jgi:hypothetical protein
VARPDTDELPALATAIGRAREIVAGERGRGLKVALVFASDEVSPDGSRPLAKLYLSATF